MAAAARRPLSQRLRQRWSALWQRRWLRRSFLTAAVVGALGIALLVVAYFAVSLPEAPETAQTTVVLDAQGNVLGELFDTENRVDVPLDQVAPVLRDAVLAAEDREFYSHGGLSPIGMGRAIWSNVRGKSLQGGSTITQQLVKNTYLSPERSVTRKAKEAILSVKLERQWSKDEILERYLNTVYFGRGAYGIEKAAKIWFGISAKELDLPQSALLAGLIRAPESADPAKDPEVAEGRRQIVLNAMAKLDMVTEEEADAAAATPIATQARVDPDALLQGSSAYFVAQVRSWLLERYGERVAFGGGLQVQTTLDPAMQKAAETAVFGTLDRPEDPDAALVSIDDSGAIRAMIGGRDFKASKVNLAMGAAGGGQGRQPGSTFKPFVLAAALEDGIPVSQRYPGPRQMVVDVGGIEYPVENYNGEGFGTIDLLDATAKSVNTVYVQLVAETGPRAVADVANELGVTAELEPHPSIALGAEEVSPLDLATAYMTFGRRGSRVEPFLVQKVSDSSGAVIYSADTRSENVYPPQFADVVNFALQGVIERGTGRAADIGRPAAGKTGTTQSNTDAWFVGYTPTLSTAVWMGYKDGNDRKMESVHGRAVTGGSFPAQIWQQFMSTALEGTDSGEFEPPSEELLNQKPRGDEGETTPSTERTSSTSSTSSTTSSSTSSTTSSTVTSGDSSTTTTTAAHGDGATTTSTTSPEPTTTTTSTTEPEQEPAGGGQPP